jgi:glycosyltransferase involved in cell wall biosynthesis
MPAAYSALDRSVSSSAYGEGTPNVVAESMACGIPCIVTDVGDSAFTVGVLGEVVPRQDSAALAAAILTSLDKSHDREALRAHVREHFSYEHLISRTQEALARLIDGKRVTP